MRKGAKRRLQDFKERAGFDPESVFSFHGRGSCVCVHPLADETTLLIQLGVDASSCTKVDAYWAFECDVIFLQILTKSHAMDRLPGYYIRKAEGGYINMVAIITEPVVDSSVLKRTIEYLADIKFDLNSLGESLVPLENSAGV